MSSTPSSQPSAAPTSTVQLASSLVLLAVLSLFPAFGLGDYWQGVIITSLYLAILALGWNLLSGYTGLFSLAPAAFAMLGAYVPALLWTYAGVPSASGIALGFVVTAFLGFVVGMLTLRLAGPYLALTTLGLAEILRLIALNSFDITRGEMGLQVPPIFANQSGYYYFFVVFTALVILSLHFFIRSRFGLFLRAIRNDEIGARARGVRTVFWKVFAFSASSGLSGLAGAAFGHYVVIVSPSLGHLFITSEVISMVVIGGMGTLIGPLLGALLVHVSSEFLRAVGDLQHIALALLVIVFVRFCREGIVGRLAAMAHGRSLGKAKSAALEKRATAP
jgi:branched-chain amino acid transport system permease protein